MFIFSTSKRSVKLRNAEESSKLIKLENILQLDEVTYEIVKDDPEVENYLVNTAIGVCSCPVGRTGTFCKHQFAIKAKYGVHCSAASPDLTPQEKEELYYVANGFYPKVPDFYGQHDDTVSVSHKVTPSLDSATSLSRSTLPILPQVDIESVVEGLRLLTVDLEKKITENPSTLGQPCLKFLKTYAQNHKCEIWLSCALSTFGKDFYMNTSKGRRPIIPVQPHRPAARKYTAESRRAQLGGRMPKNYVGKKKKSISYSLPVWGKSKRKHSLAMAIRNNVANGCRHDKTMLN